MSEYKFVEKPFLEQLRALGWKIIDQGPGIRTDKPRFLMKVRHFLKAHSDHITTQKLHRNEQLTSQDLAELERILRDETEASGDDIAVITSEGGSGLFIRSLIGSTAMWQRMRLPKCLLARI